MLRTMGKILPLQRFLQNKYGLGINVTGQRAMVTKLIII
jgi:hypothetical protein